MNDSSLQFGVAPNAQVTLITVVVNVVLLGTALVLLVLGVKLALAEKSLVPRYVPWVLLGGAGVDLAILAVLANMKLWGYEVGGGQLSIRHGLTTKRFVLQAPVEVAPESKPFEGAIRIFGSGGLWSYYGKFSSPRLGRFEAYLTDPKEAVVIKSQGQVVVVSPRERGAFIEAIKKLK